MIEILDIKRLPADALVVLRMVENVSSDNLNSIAAIVRQRADELGRSDVRFLWLPDGSNGVPRYWGMYCRWHNVWVQLEGRILFYPAPELVAAAMDNLKHTWTGEQHKWDVTEFGRQDVWDAVDKSSLDDTVCPVPTALYRR